jgi:hypothetical protein
VSCTLSTHRPRDLVQIAVNPRRTPVGATLANRCRVHQRFILGLILAVVLSASFALPAFAQTQPPPPFCPREGNRVVVDAYEHENYGAVVGDGRSVIVSMEATEVHRPGSPDAFVVDAAGVRHDAQLVGTNRKARASLLRVATPLSASPQQATAAASDRCIFREDRDAAAIATQIESPTNEAPFRRSWIGYGGAALAVEFAPNGGGWFGPTLSVGTRYRDILQLRVDASVFMLASVNKTPEDDCSEPPCAPVGGRVVLTHTVGPRLAIGGRALTLAFTPSVGWSLGGQSVLDRFTPRFDARSPNLWQAFTFGGAMSYGLGELRVLARWPSQGMPQPTIDIAFGAFL